jgi:hypothetical protein
MKKQHMTGIAILVLLSFFMIGISGASAVDAKVKDVYWNVGNAGFFGNTYSHAGTSLVCTIPAGGSVTFKGPLTVPSSVNGKPCSVRKLYVYWVGESTCYIGDTIASTAGHDLASVTTDFYGTGISQLNAISLGGRYEVPRGLQVEFGIHNSDSAGHAVYIMGYGAVIQHAV